MSNIEGLLATMKVRGFLTRTKSDEKLTEDLHSRTGASSDSGQYRKSLFPKSACGDDSVYEKLIKAKSALSVAYYGRSLMWEKPFRLVSNKTHAEFDALMQRLLGDLRTAHDAFIVGYPALKALAKASRGTEWKEEDYPDPEKLAAGFSCDVFYSAIPTSNQFAASLAGDAIERAKAQLNSANEQRMKAAVSDVWRQIMEPLENMIERLSDPDARIFDSIVTNIQDVSSRIPALNIENDSALADAKARLDQLVAGLDPEALRKNPELRTTTVASAATLVAALGSRKFAA